MPSPHPTDQRAPSAIEHGARPASEPLLARDPILDHHRQDSSSLAPAVAQHPRRALRSTTLWLIFLLTVVALAGLIFMAFHLHPVGAGQIRGPADEAAPNAPSDYKHR